MSALPSAVSATHAESNAVPARGNTPWHKKALKIALIFTLLVALLLAALAGGLVAAANPAAAQQQAKTPAVNPSPAPVLGWALVPDEAASFPAGRIDCHCSSARQYQAGERQHGRQYCRPDRRRSSCIVAVYSARTPPKVRYGRVA